jgi:sugar lactone lactonase YvrE
MLEPLRELLTPETVIDAHATIGESPLWVATERALYWIDVKAPALHRYQPHTGDTRTWRVTSDLGGFAMLEDGGALVALRHGLYRLDLHSGKLQLLAPPPFDPSLFRFNEGACDANGRFWIGVMFDPIEGSLPEQRGQLHSYTLDGGLRAEPDAAELHNGMAFSVDGSTLFLSHSNTRQIFKFDYEGAAGRLSNRRLFATIPENLGIPDGAAIDVDNAYWCALHGAGKLRRFRADGSVDRDIDMPFSQPTMCAFADEQLATLYVTSASDKMSDTEKRLEPLAGALIRLRPGVRGIERPFLAR